MAETNIKTTTKMKAVLKYSARNVAFKPPNRVYAITPTGMRNAAIYTSIPVRAFTTAAPPKTSIAVTMMFGRNAKLRITL